MEIEHWDDLLAYLVESREEIYFTGHIAKSVERHFAVDRTLRARFAVMALIFKICKYFPVSFPRIAGWLYQNDAKGDTNEILQSC